MFCTRCGKQIADRAIICVHCSAPVISFTKDGTAYAVDTLSLKPYKVE
ncbi:MAG: zinc-ribbon domain-containing protein [Clostridia bacterium]|nr:zinc-ribbon domain-containing protein [Clostridia bacterium]